VKPLFYVDKPAFTPLPYGLLSTLASSIRSSVDPHWENGVRYETLCAASDTTYSDCLVVSGTGQPPAPAPVKNATAETEQRGALPFTVFAEVDCSAPGFWDRAEDSVRGVITRSEQRAVEYAIWTGIAGGASVVHPHLASTTEVLGTDYMATVLDTATTVVSGGSIVTSLGNLEAELASCYDGVGIIHVPRSLVPELANAQLLIQDGSRWVTPNGNVYVFGSGYPGTGPDGTGNGWMYATSMPFIYRSVKQIFRVRESIDRSTNTVRAIAEVTYVIGWECCTVATQVASSED
jgi:hypothetical protein